MRICRQLAAASIVFLLFQTPAWAEYSDPWEGLNRKIFVFNDTLDHYALKPVANTYVKVLPKPVRGLVSTFFSSAFASVDGVNLMLQGELKEGGKQLSRFLINCTLGMVCMVDVADSFGIESRRSDFGLTLAQWGVAEGPYVMLPLLGPYTLRDASAIYPDLFLSPVTYSDDVALRNKLTALKVIDKRAGLLQAEDLIVGDRYTFIREAYLQNRRFEVSGEEAEDDF